MNVEEKRFEIEQKRLALEEETKRHESKFFNRHFGAIIAAVLSLATIVVSGTQVWVAYINKNKELAATKIQKQQVLEASKLEQNRRWGMDAAKFIFEKRSLIFSKNPEESTLMRNVMIATFPLELTEKIFLKIEKGVESEDQKKIWAAGQDAIDSLSLSTDEPSSVHGNAKDLMRKDGGSVEITSKYIEQLVKDFKGPDRRLISNKISNLYDHNKDAVISGLISGILPKDDRWSYRVNIYIARTLERIKPHWSGSDTQIERIRELKSRPNYKDETFRARIDGALANFERQ